MPLARYPRGAVLALLRLQRYPDRVRQRPTDVPFVEHVPWRCAAPSSVANFEH
jgi:hypothetical protein